MSLLPAEDSWHMAEQMLNLGLSTDWRGWILTGV